MNRRDASRATGPDGIAAATASPGEAEEALRSAVIMMVDDEPINMAVVRTYLEDAGYRNFILTADSSEALSLIERESPDCLLLDLVMPGVSGFDILSALRGRPQLGRIPAIVLTSSDDSATKLRALELGASDFLAKPVDPSELTLRLRNTLAAKAYQDRLIYYDGLTGLPNRRLILEKLEAAIATADDTFDEVALLHINLDRFKTVNDTLGHAAGDALLQTVGQRLVLAVGELTTSVPHAPPARPVLGRMGGDEFCLVIPGRDAEGVGARMAQRFLEQMRRPVEVQGHEVFVTPTIGIALWPRDAARLEQLVARAGVAMTAAKAQGRNRALAFSADLHRRSVEQLRFESELRRAVQRAQLELHYQPKVDLREAQVVGAEALVRWRHPELGLVPPGQFIPLAEETGLIVDMGEWILGEALRQCREWERAGLGSVRVAVNLSSKQFSEAGLLAAIDQALGDSGANPDHVTLEVTESMLLGDVERSIAMMHEMRGKGLRLSIDDFGTGYSSFSYLKRFPLHELKIDRSFVQDLETDASDVAIVSAIIAMAHALELRVVAEGVETEGQRAVLARERCDIYQGYLFSKPLPARAFADLLATRRVA